MEQLALFGSALCAAPDCGQPTPIKRRYGGSPMKYCSHACGSRAWRIANRPLVNERARLQRDPEKCRERWAKYYAENKKDLIRKRIEFDPVRRRAIARAYHARHRERRLAENKRWRQENSKHRAQMFKIYSQQRRARVLGAPGSCSREQLTARWDYFGGRCWMCGCEATAIDHVIPLARGGSNWPANLRPACRSCNSAKGARSWRLYTKQKEAA